MPKRLKEKLEDIEHAYFCYEKDCPICNGINYRLAKDYKIPEPPKDIQNIEVFPGEIWKLLTKKIYPIYVLIIKDKGFYKECVRVSEFTDFKGKGDIVINSWLIEPWNHFEVLNFRLLEKVDKINPIYLNEIKKNKNFNETNLILSMFREIEIEYQNDSFIQEDSYLLAKLKKEKNSILDNIVNQIKELPIFEIKFPSLNSAKIFALSANNSFFFSIKDLFRKKNFNKKKIFATDDLEIYFNITEDITAEIEVIHKLNLLPDKVVLLKQNRPEKIDPKISQKKIKINFIPEKSLYTLSITFLNQEIKLKFKIL